MTNIDQQLLERIVRNAVRYVEGTRDANRRGIDSAATARFSAEDALRQMQRDIDRLPRSFVNNVLRDRR